MTPVAHRVTTLGPCSVEAASRLSRLVVEASVEAASRFCVEASRPGLNGIAVDKVVCCGVQVGGGPLGG